MVDSTGGFARKPCRGMAPTSPHKAKRPTLWVVAKGFAGRGRLCRPAAPAVAPPLTPTPVFGFGQRTALGDFYHVAQLVFALFVMGVVLARTGNDLAVELVLDTALD